MSVDGKIILNGALKEYYGKTLAGYVRFNPYPANVENRMSS